MSASEPKAKKPKTKATDVNEAKDLPKRIFRWNGKLLSEKRYKNYKRLAHLSKEKPTENVTDESETMVCDNCQKRLKLSHYEGEERKKSGYFYRIRCQFCSIMNKVPTSISGTKAEQGGNSKTK